MGCSSRRRRFGWHGLVLQAVLEPHGLEYQTVPPAPATLWLRAGHDDAGFIQAALQNPEIGLIHVAVAIEIGIGAARNDGIDQRAGTAGAEVGEIPAVYVAVLVEVR